MRDSIIYNIIKCDRLCGSLRLLLVYGYVCLFVEQTKITKGPKTLELKFKKFARPLMSVAEEISTKEPGSKTGITTR